MAATAAGIALGNILDADPPQSLQITCPAVFMPSGIMATARILDKNGRVAADEKGAPCLFEKTPLLIKEIERKNNRMNDFKADFLVPLPNKVKLNKKDEYTIELTISSADVGNQIITFRSPAGNDDFTEYRVTLETAR